MSILVLNCGSSSVKFALFDEALKRLKDGKADVAADGYEASVRDILGQLQGHSDVTAVGHRVVHGGSRYTEPVLISSEVQSEISALRELAPEHNGHSLAALEAAQQLLPGVPQVAAFDTAFHQTLPPRAYLYGLPYEQFEKFGIRRFGFHGLSHRYAMERYALLHGMEPAALKLITCHLGNGCSVCAIENGRSIDTSMGFTPLEGLVMGSRCGDIDPAAVLHIMSSQGLSTSAVLEVLNKKSGLLGISGVTSDMRKLLEAHAAGNQRCDAALDVFCYRVRKMIGSYLAALNGADAVIFTGGIGEHTPLVRERVCGALTGLGVQIDHEKNYAQSGEDRDIAARGSAINIAVITADEESVIAREVRRLVSAQAPT